MAARKATAVDHVQRARCACGADVIWDLDITERYEQIADARRPTLPAVIAALDAGRPVYRWVVDLDNHSYLSPVIAAAILADIARGYPLVLRLAHECDRLPRGHREPA